MNRNTVIEGPCLARVAGLPATRTEPLAAAEVAGVLRDFDACRRELESLAEPVCDLLFKAVPRMSSPTARREVLAWRRAAHSARPWDVGPALRTDVYAELDRPARTVLDRWSAASTRTAYLRDALAKAVSEAADREETALRALLAEPALADALALVSPVFSDRVRTLGNRRLGRKELLTAYRYAVRTTLKTSPLSSLTEIAPVGGTGVARSRVSLHPLIGQALLHAAAPWPCVRDHLRWRTNGTLRRSPTGGRMSEALVQVVDGFSWVYEEVIDARERPDLAQVPDVATLPSPQVARLLDSGLLDIEEPCPRRELIDWLADRLRQSADPDALLAADHLRMLADALAAVADGTAAARAEELGRIHEHVRGALRTLGSDDWPLRAVTPVYEDRVTAPVAPPEAEHRAALARYATSVLTSMQVSTAYRALVRAFVQRFGPGGTCEDVFGFCRDLTEAGWPFDPSGAQDGAARPGRSSCVPSLAVLAQTTPSGPAGSGQVVVNQLAAGDGALAARFHTLLDGADGPAQRLRTWPATLYPHARTVEVVPSWNVNPLQENSCGLLPPLHWPLGPRLPASGVALEELTLVHDAERNALELQAADGTAVAPVYSGPVPQYLVAGPVRVLLVLGNPWVVPADPADHEGREGQPAPAPPSQDSLSRARHAGVIVRRESRQCPADQVPRPAPHESPADYVTRVDRWRRALDLPAEVYVRAERDPAAPPTDRLHKPLWLAFASPTGLAALTQLATSAGRRAVVFTECLPGREKPDPQERSTEYLLHYAATGRQGEE